MPGDITKREVLKAVSINDIRLDDVNRKAMLDGITKGSTVMWCVLNGGCGINSGIRDLTKEQLTDAQIVALKTITETLR